MPGRPETGRASPVLTGGSLFEGEGRPHVLQMELPLSAEEMVAALYGEHKILQDVDLATDEEVWAHTALVVVQDGLTAVEHLADEILVQEHRRTLAAPQWLALCRRRVAELTAGPT
jgi:hypothetical protein